MEGGIGSQVGMKISRQKTEYLQMRARDGHEEGLLEMKGKIVKQVEEFKYVRSTMQADGGLEREITKRIQAAWGAWRKITGVMCDKNVSGNVKWHKQFQKVT